MTVNKMKNKLIIYFLLFSSFVYAQQITIDSSIIIESQNYSFNNNTHSICSTVDSTLYGVDIYNGYLLIELGTFNNQNDAFLDYSYSSFYADSGKVSLLLFDSLNQQIISRQDYDITNQSNSITLHLSSFYSQGDNMRLAFYASKNNPYIQFGSTLNIGGLYYDQNTKSQRKGSVIEQEVVKSQLNYSIYPNPTEDVIFLQSNDKIKNVRIVDMFGKVIVSKELKRVQSVNFDLSNQSKGIYYVYIQSGDEQTIEKIILR